MVVIAYDITDEKRLNKVAQFLEEKGFRVQKSVFELDMSVRKANLVLKEVEKLIKKEEGDKCFLFNVSDKQDIQGHTSAERIF